MTKSEVNDILRGVVKDEFIKLWWDLRLPGLGHATPNQVWETDPARVKEYVKGYLDPTFS